jgi:hypothetical protein
MTKQRATMTTLATLGLGALLTGAALVHAGGFSALISEYTLLPLSPYAIFCGACFLARTSLGRAMATLVVCVLATALAIYYYVDFIYLNSGSMNGLVFFLVPFFQLPAAILLFIVVFFTRPRRRSNANGSNQALERTASAE